MKALNEIIRRPSGWDSLSNYAGETDFPGFLVLLTRNRDSDELTESNWRVALKRLGGESDDVQVFRFGHWACGWWEALCVKAGSNAEKLGAEMHESLEDYPILDENDFSELEMESANSVWKDCYTWRERLNYIREHTSQFEFRDFADLMGCVRGQYFAGYASELLH